MEYREHAAPAALTAWVDCAWERCDGGAPVRVVPDGCIDVIWTAGAGTQLVGANTTAFVVDLAPRTHVVGVRLRPGAAPSLLGVDARALRDARIGLERVWGDDGRRLGERLDATSDERRALLLGALADRARSSAAPDPLVAAAVARLDAAAADVRALAAGLHVSERQLRRRVASAVGYGPKRLARVLRLQRALAAARSGDELARAAADAGYADQAHFAHDCRDLAGAPPTVVLAG